MNKVLIFAFFMMTSVFVKAAEFSCVSPKTIEEKSQLTDSYINKSEKLVKKIQSLKSNSQIEKKQRAFEVLIQQAGCLSLIDPSGYIGEVLYPVYVVDKKIIEAEISKLPIENAKRLKYFIDLYANRRSKSQ